MNKQIGCVIFKVENCNPNGDPLSNMPRQFPDGHGFITDDCLKRRGFRDWLDDHERPEFGELQSMFGLDPECYHIFESRLRGFEQMEPSKAKQAALKLFGEDPNKGCSRYVDVRLFGSTLLDEEGEKGKKTRFVRTGALQIGQAVSVRPIDVQVASTVKAYPLDNKNLDAGNSMPCNDSLSLVRHGIYYAFYHITPGMAKLTGLTVQDVELFKFTMSRAFEGNRSANRVGVSVFQMVHAEHTNTLGSFSETQFEEAMVPRTNVEVPMSSADYTFADLERIRTIVGNGRVDEIVAPLR